MSDPDTTSTDYLTPAARWIVRGAGRLLSSLWGQTWVNLTLAVASAIGVAGGLPAVAPHIHLPNIVFPTVVTGGLSRVILVYESAWNMSPGQTDTILSDTSRAYLDSAVPADSSGRPAWRVWDKDTDRSGEPAEWQAAWNKAMVACAGKVPQVVAFDSAGNASAFPVPESPEELVAQLKQRGGK